MGTLEDRVIVVTGAGRGIGREHALLLASEGAKVVVNDLGGSADGKGSEAGPAVAVVEEIKAAGGDAIVSTDDVASAQGADNLIRSAIAAYGKLDGLVNNASILRDGMVFNVDDEQWESVLHVGLSGTFYPGRAAARYWRELSKAGKPVAGSIVNTTSESGLFGNMGQSNYAAAKAGVAALTEVWARELKRYGVRVNAIAPRAATRLTAQVGAAESTDPNAPMHPGNCSPWVAYLLSDSCAISGEVFVVYGGVVHRVAPWTLDDSWKLRKETRWAPKELADAVFETGIPSKAGRNTGLIR
ncbi:SDR family NAD(P)-dependent oxidoreductase [[Mycobacterium] wendilense]|uniref:SDR family NAD(P)-dependent oxidoreductase n=1 Tax=[Mycobacterium] wendilense TaxID=3064284 RepID=A0ABM9MJN5_9MYCO|nr:SDR family NAD(P)-dependent oxidoreductase [Mycolicibacterium sp. MU0050]CAJ1586864.1 SDR family NAD(P)-dependent oxidoreductase [Mycolicibacterium sp. MU0050]